MKSKEDFLADPEFVRWVRHPSPELETFWTNWITANPESLAEFKFAKEILVSVKYSEPIVPVGKKQELLSNILKESPKIDDATERSDVRQNGHFIRWVYRIAAVLLFSVGLFWLMSENRVSESTTYTGIDEVFRSRSTNQGEKLQFTMEDGTRVWINSTTEISFSTGQTKTRKVYLKGEAYFEVSHDSLRPFQVFSGDLVTTVLGTSFNINTKETDRIQVALLEGKVQVRNSKLEEIDFLEPGEMLQYNESNKEKTKRFFDIKEVSAWRNGRILFKNASLIDVKEKLEDWYGVRIMLINDDNKEWKVNANYENETLENVLSSLSYVHKFRFEINGKIVKIQL